MNSGCAGMVQLDIGLSDIGSQMWEFSEQNISTIEKVNSNPIKPRPQSNSKLITDN